jgi:hypothetical protein
MQKIDANKIIQKALLEMVETSGPVVVEYQGGMYRIDCESVLAIRPASLRDLQECVTGEPDEEEEIQ